MIEACFSYGVHVALLYAQNLPSAFFDLKSGEADTVLQKMRNYHMRLAVIYPPGSPELSDRFKELLLDERRGRDFGLFETRAAARAWLARMKVAAVAHEHNTVAKNRKGEKGEKGGDRLTNAAISVKRYAWALVHNL